MRPKLNVVFVCMLLGGCIIYPNRHISVPKFSVSIHDQDVKSVSMASGSSEEKFTCEMATEIEKTSAGIYVSQPEYSWIDSVFFLPADCGLPVLICVATDQDMTRYWQGSILVSCNGVPSEIAIQCSTYNDKFNCAQKDN